MNPSNNHFKGIFFMLLASLFFAVNDALVKYAVKQLGTDNSLFNVVFVRAIFTSILILATIFLFGKFDIKKLFYDKRSYVRGFFEVLAAFSFLTALMLMPMGDVYTLLNTMPLIITAAGAIILKEKVGIRRWSAVFIGFIGKNRPHFSSLQVTSAHFSLLQVTSAHFGLSPSHFASLQVTSAYFSLLRLTSAYFNLLQLTSARPPK